MRRSTMTSVRAAEQAARTFLLTERIESERAEKQRIAEQSVRIECYRAVFDLLTRLAMFDDDAFWCACGA